MTTIDLSGIYDNCYSGYEDFSAELVLQRNKAARKWENENVEFYKDETRGWAYRNREGGYNYGYDSLREAVVKYAGAIASKKAADKKFIASRLVTHTFHLKTLKGHIFCKVTVRHFFGECDQEKTGKINAALSTAFSALASGSYKQSVMAQIRETRDIPRQPRLDAPEQSKRKKGEYDL